MIGNYDRSMSNCPKCNSDQYSKVGFSWWGGVLGPKLFNHVKCDGCGATFNSKTGKPNTTAIIIYSIVVSAIVIALVVAFQLGG